MTYYFTHSKCLACDVELDQSANRQITFCSACKLNLDVYVEYAKQLEVVQHAIGRLEDTCVDCYSEAFGATCRHFSLYETPTCVNFDCKVNFKLNCKRQNINQILKRKFSLNLANNQ